MYTCVYFPISCFSSPPPPSLSHTLSGFAFPSVFVVIPPLAFVAFVVFVFAFFAFHSCVAVFFFLATSCAFQRLQGGKGKGCSVMGFCGGNLVVHVWVLLE